MNLYIFNRKSRAAIYGIGTYVRELTDYFSSTDLHVTFVHLSDDKPEFRIEKGPNFIQHWYIPSPVNSTYQMHDSLGIAYLLRLHIEDTNELVFHLNYMSDIDLATNLRQAFQCQIVLTVHFMNWSFILQGNLERLKRIKSDHEQPPTDVLANSVLNSIKEEQKLLKFVDHVICLGQYARDMLQDVYDIEPDKITVIGNGLKDEFRMLDAEEKSSLRKRYLVSEEEKIILFVGRVDETKGVASLGRAFRNVLENDARCRLWIVGDGSYDLLTKEAKGIWSKVCFTGRLDKEQLYDLYRLADVGVVPSCYEAFGYVAIEMMMCSLPMVVTATSGLDEIVEEGVTGLKAPLVEVEGRMEVDCDALVQKIVFLLNQPERRWIMEQKAREEYLKKYTVETMGWKMMESYNVLFCAKNNV